MLGGSNSMPVDIHPDHALRLCVVSNARGHSLPFSKGMLATSVLATGIETPIAYEVAHIVQHELLDRNTREISSNDLIQLTAEKIATVVSEEIAENYLLWRKARRIGRPMIISILGSSGVGKSVLATRLALRLGINRVVTTDAIREVLRTVVPAAVLPELHVSSYEATKSDLSEPHDQIYKRQSTAVASACAAVAKRYINERKSTLFEGVHLLPGYLTRELAGMEEDPIVVEVLLTLKDESMHNARLVHRLSTEPGRDGARHLRRFDVIRALQGNMRKMASAAGVTEIDVSSNEDLTQIIVREIVNKAIR